MPKINKELWNTSAFKKANKDVDRCFQTAQRYMSQGLIQLVSLMDKSLETDQAEEFRLAKESFQLLAYAHRDISNIRRQKLKGVVSDKNKQLCNDSTPLTGNLLGDDLEKQIKTLDEMRKVGFDLSTIGIKTVLWGNINPEVVPLLIASKRNLEKVTSKCNIHALHKLGKTILFYLNGAGLYTFRRP